MGYKSILLYGAPGSGKTTMACTLPGKSLLIDVDNKANEMTSIVDNDNITIKPITAKLTQAKLKLVLLSKTGLPQPKGYLELCDIITDLETKFPEDINNVIVDSVTKVCEHLKRAILWNENVSSMRIQDWGIFLTNLECFVNTVISLPCNKVLVCHDNIEQDALTGEIVYRPLIEGQMRHKIAQSFTEVYYMSPIMTKDKKPTYRVLTCNDGKRIARTALNLDVYEKADLDYILKKGDVGEKIV